MTHTEPCIDLLLGYAKAGAKLLLDLILDPNVGTALGALASLALIVSSVFKIVRACRCRYADPGSVPALHPANGHPSSTEAMNQASAGDGEGMAADPSRTAGSRPGQPPQFGGG